MTIYSFDHFIDQSISLVISRSNIAETHRNLAETHCNLEETPPDLAEPNRKILYDLFHKFFIFIHKYEKENYFGKDLFDRMYHEFDMFMDFVFNNISFCNFESLCTGISTQLSKFMNMYKQIQKFKTDYLCQYGYLGHIITTFYEVIYNIEWVAQNNKYIKDFEEKLLLSDTLTSINVDFKSINSENHSEKVHGKHRDYQKHIYNKGLNKKKRKNEHNVYKVHKTKNRPDIVAY